MHSYFQFIAPDFKQRIIQAVLIFLVLFVFQTALAPNQSCFGWDPISMLLASWRCHADSLHGSILFLFEGCDSWPYGAHPFVFCGAITSQGLWWRLGSRVELLGDCQPW